MKMRIESDTGEFLTELDLAELDVNKMIQYALLRLQLEKNNIEYNIPLNEDDIKKLISYAIKSMMNDEIKRGK